MQGTKGLAILVLVSLGVILMVVVAADEAEAATITVPDDYPSINSAMENVSDYDTLFIKDGTYYEAVVVWRPLTIMGESMDGTVIEMDDPFGMLIVSHKTKVSNLTIQGTSVSAGLILQASGCVIEDVTVQNNLWGMWVNRGDNNIIRNVQCLDNDWQGLLVEEADHTLVEGVTCSGNNEGINVRAAIGTTVKDCRMVGNRVHGFLGHRLIGFYDNKGLDLIDCVMSNNLVSGCEIEYFDDLTIEGCTVEDNAAHGIIIRNSNNTIVRGCTVRNYLKFGIGISGSWVERGCLIENNVLEDENTSWSDIMVRYMTDCQIINNSVTCFGAPIAVAASNDTLVSGNVLTSVEHNDSIIYPGIVLSRGKQGQGLPATNVTVEECTITGFAQGFSIRGVKDLIIRNCEVTDAMVGIYCEGFAWGDVPYDGGSITDCTFDGCGFDIEGMIDVTVEGNVIAGADVGLFFNATTYEIMENEFVDNIIRDCSEYGMLFNGTNGTNLFYYNTFLNNTEHAADPNPGDVFDNVKYGNFWDDYRQRYPEANIVDLVWDTPYGVGGTTVMDERPLAYQYDAEAPMADAGEDGGELAGDLVQFDGTGSTDNMGILNYTWTFMYADTPVELHGAVAVFPFHLIGIYRIDLVVKDAWKNADNDSVLILIYDDEAPVADAGDDQNVSMGQTFTLDGGASTDNGLITSYKWVIDPEGLAIMLEFQVVQASIDVVGTYPVVLSVIDEGLNTDFDDMTIIVIDSEVPFAYAGVDQMVGQNVEVTLDGSGSSDNVAVVSWTWTFMDEGAPVTLEGEVITYTFSIVGEYPVSLNVSDEAGNWELDEMVVSVRDTEPPMADAGEDEEVDQGATVTFDGSGSSDNVGIDEFSWTFAEASMTIYLSGETPSHTFDLPGSYEVTLWVVDAEGNVGQDQVLVTVNAVVSHRSWSLGPFTDADGVLGGVRIEVLMDGTTYIEYTHDDGIADFWVAVDDLVSPASVVATKEGWEDLEFDVVLDENGDATGSIPVMKQEKGGDGDDDDEIDWLAWSLVIILCIAFGGSLLYLSAAAKKAGLDE